MVTGDSQPVELRESALTILPYPAGSRHSRPCMVAHRGDGFSAALSFVGSERIGSALTREWLERFSRGHASLDLDAFCNALVAALTTEWRSHGYDSCLWVFISGASAGEPIFRAVRNCGPDQHPISWLYTNVTQEFVWHDDLANHVAEYGKPSESRLQVLAHTMALYRNGVLRPANVMLNDFQGLMQEILSGGYPGFAPVGTLAAYASIVKMRGEFIKRIFQHDKGVYQSKDKPISGTLYVWRIELDGSIYDHSAKSASQAVKLL